MKARLAVHERRTLVCLEIAQTNARRSLSLVTGVQVRTWLKMAIAFSGSGAVHTKRYAVEHIEFRS